MLEVQAAAARGATARAADRWIATARHRLRWAPASDAQVQLALRNAHALWIRLDEDDGHVVELVRQLVDLLQEVGAERPLATGERGLPELQAAPIYRPPAAWAG